VLKLLSVPPDLAQGRELFFPIEAAPLKKFLPLSTSASQVHLLLTTAKHRSKIK
jgi:hypothetical protein